jgi:Zn finger protein HypA/HybF involved in hydrogenase expression
VCHSVAVDQSLVVVAAFRLRDEAHAAQAALSGEGVAAEVISYDETIERRCAGAFPDGFDIVVPASQEEPAVSLLQHFWVDGSVEEREPVYARCPHCGSLEVTRLLRLRIFAVAAVVLLLGGAITGEGNLFLLMIGIVGALLLLMDESRCRACGERWKGGNDPVAPERAREVPDVLCPRCGSPDTLPIVRRREKAVTLLVNMVVPPLLFVWPFLPRHRCNACANEWR